MKPAMACNLEKESMMRHSMTALALLTAVVLICGVAVAAPGTLYQQEGTVNDGPAGINAAGQGLTGTLSDNWTNWKYQYGSYSADSVYAGDNGQLLVSETGDINLEVEADIEMFIHEEIANHKIYFHLGNIFTATDSDKTAYASGSFYCNNGQYVGLTIGPNKNVEKVGEAYTGKIINGMHSDRDTYRNQNNNMDIEIMLSEDGTNYRPCVNYGEGSHGTILNTIWWLIGNGAPGSYTYSYRIKLLPAAAQPDGDYHFDPAVVTAPIL